MLYICLTSQIMNLFQTCQMMFCIINKTDQLNQCGMTLSFNKSFEFYMNFNEVDVLFGLFSALQSVIDGASL